MSRIYTVYDNKTDMPVIVDGTARECAEAMKLKSLNSFYAAYNNHKKGKAKKWTIILTSVGQPFPRAITFGSRLRNNRIKQGLTTRDLEMRSGISAQTISKLEYGAHEPSLFTAKCLADALHLSLDYMASLERGKYD